MKLLSNSKFGFGMMRLPRGEDGEIDIAKTSVMVDDFLSKGFTYFDTAYVYNGSEVAVRKALVERHPRDSFTIASKLPTWNMNGPEDVERIFNETLERLGTDYLDFYLLHNVTAENIDTFNKYDCWNWGKQKKAEGKIRHFGFSSHSTPEFLDKVLSEHPEIEFVQLQLNYFDWENEKVRAREMYEVVRKHDLPIIVMEPVRGGSLASLPDEPAGILRAADPSRSIASWALRYIASKEGVMTVLSGMSDETQVRDNLATFENFKPMTAEEDAMMMKVADILHSYPTIPCTGCKYCVEGCPMSINIPGVLAALNQVRMFGKSDVASKRYADVTKEGGKAGECIGCGACAGTCPQHLDIPALMIEAAEVFGN